MKKTLLMLLLLAVSINALSQAESFDIATFTPPAGWDQSMSNGALLFEDQRDANKRTSFCQISIFPSRSANREPLQHFMQEWNERVVSKTGTDVTPQVGTDKTRHGWTVVTGVSNITHKGATYTCILVTVWGFDKVMSVLVNYAGEQYLAQVQKFLNSFKLVRSPAAVAGNPAGDKAAVTGTPDFHQYSFTTPEKWTRQDTKDHILLTQSQTSEPGCTIIILPPQPTSGDLEKDVQNIFQQMYPGWQYRSAGEKQYDLSKGYTPQGLEYCMMEAPMSKLSADGSRYDGFEDGAALVIKADNQIAIIAARHNTSMMAHNDCLNQYETWRRFFNSFTIQNAVVPQNPEATTTPQRIVGVWKLTGNGPALGEYVFAANGNYQLTGAIGTSRTTTDDRYEYLHLKTYAFEGDGSYSITGNELSLKKRGDTNAEQIQFRFEKVNHGNTGWKDRLYLLKKDPTLGSVYEVCYERE